MSGRRGESQTPNHISLALHEAGGRSASDGLDRQRMRSGLVITQVALAIVLLAGAGLTLKSFWHAAERAARFRAAWRGELRNRTARSRSTKHPEQKDAFWTQLLQRVQSIPGVEAAAVNVRIVPFDDNEE